MRVLIDLRWMVPGYTGGIEVQARAFVDTLLQIDRDNTYVILAPSEVCSELDLHGRNNFQVVAADGPAYYLARAGWFLRGKRRGAFEDPVMRRAAAGTDVLYLPDGLFNQNLPSLPAVATIADVQHEYFPEFFDPLELANRRQAFRQTAARASHILAISEFTRATLIDQLGIAPTRVSVAYDAVHPRLIDLARKPALIPDVAKKYDLAPGFLFYPANTWRHKNHIALIEALALLREQWGLTPQLVCTGAAKEAQGEVLQKIDALGLAGQVRFLGYIPFDDLAGLYRQAGALMFPSLFEGFGMPVLEAMTFGCPVACSRLTSLPEIAGPAARYFDPHHPEEIAASIAELITQPGLRAELIRLGDLQAKRFSFLDHTRCTLEALQQAAGPSGARALQGITWSIQDERLGKQPGSKRQAVALALIAASKKEKKKGQALRALMMQFKALLTSPRTAFYGWLYPALRDRLLRGKLARMI